MTRDEMIDRILGHCSTFGRDYLEKWDDEGLADILSCYMILDSLEERPCICGAKHTSRPDWHLKSCDDYRNGRKE